MVFKHKDKEEQFGQLFITTEVKNTYAEWLDLYLT
jgi:hypothetical protein